MTIYTEKQIAEASCRPAGEYDFTVTAATYKTSKAAVEAGELEPNMIEVNLRIFQDEGTFLQRDWLMVNDARFAYKVKHFCESLGLEYCEETLANESTFEGKSGRVKLGLNKEGTQNSVKDYIPATDTPISKPKPTGKTLSEELGDEIGF